MASATILVAIDFGEMTAAVVAAAVEQARGLGNDLQFLYVVEDLSRFTALSVPHISLDEVEREMQQSAQGKMAKLLEEHRADGVKMSGAVGVGKAAEQIVAMAKQSGAPLIVMGTHSYSGIEKMVLGSVAEKVLRTAPCSVLVVKGGR
ncbi:MAG: universal stress protein [Thermodesulfobacteriota bacterium]